MADDEPPAPPKLPAAGCGLLFGGFFVAGLVGMGLAVWVSQTNAPQWLIPVAFFAPPVAFLVVFGAVAVPRFLRIVREAQRTAPSPESLAAPLLNPDEPDGMGDGFPTVPRIETHPGRTLSHRLERVGMTPGCQFGCAVAVAAFWNGIVSVFVYQLFARWNRGQAVQWLEALFLVPFVLVGLAMLAFALLSGLQWVVSLLVGRVEVEVADHPLPPGGRSRVHVAQAGLFRLTRVTVELVCTEEATYVAGTSKSTARKEVEAVTVSDPEQSPDGGNLPLTAEFAVPAGAMHSFRAPNNEIKWTVRVAARVLGVLSFRDNYSVCVVPAERGAG